MASVTDGPTETASPSARNRNRLLFLAYIAAAVVVALVPLALSPPVQLTLEGPSIAPANEEIAFSGRFTLAGFGLGGGTVDVYLDESFLQRVPTDAEGGFTVMLRLAETGPRVLRAHAAPGRYLEAQTETLSFVAVLAPNPATAAQVVRAGDDATVSWSAPAADEARPVQTWRVYARDPGAPWALAAELPADAARHTLARASSTEFAVAAANVAGESAWIRAD